MDPQATGFDAELGQAFGFTAQQLAVNRRGELAEGQVTPLAPIAWGLVLLAVGIASAVMVVRRKGGRGFPIPLVIIGVLFGGFGGYLAFDGLAGRLAPEVAVYEGPIELQSQFKSATVRVQLGDAAVQSDASFDEAWDALERENRYRAYYVPRPGVLLSLEPL